MWKLSQKAEIQKAGLGSNKAPNSITHYLSCGPSGEFPAQPVNEMNFHLQQTNSIPSQPQSTLH